MEIDDNKAKEAIASILKKSLIRIRSLALKSDFDAIDQETYHVHNLPSKLLLPLHIPSLKYYMEIERVDFLAHSDPAVEQCYKTDWEIIDLYIKGKQTNPPPPAS